MNIRQAIKEASEEADGYDGLILTEADASKRLTDMILEAIAPAGDPPTCFCGVPMDFIGYGAYPYDCIAKDKTPNAPIWSAEKCGHNGWTDDQTFRPTTQKEMF